MVIEINSNNMMTEDNNYKGDSTNSKKSYPELLKSEHWKNRRQHILLRDGNVCQDCHRRGVHNGSYFRIEEIADLNNLLPVRLNGKDLTTFCDELYWSDVPPNVLDAPISFTSEDVGNNLYSYTMTYQTFKNRFEFITDKKLVNPPHYDKAPICIYKEMKLSFNENKETLKGHIHMFAFRFNEGISNANFASITVGKYKTEICIATENTLYYFDFIPLNPSNLPLHVHHQYYIKGKEPWDYDDSALITLCADCHQNRHSSSVPVPLYNHDKSSILKTNIPICDRCNGSGYLPEYDYHLNGICFKCWGEGVPQKELF